MTTYDGKSGLQIEQELDNELSGVSKATVALAIAGGIGMDMGVIQRAEAMSSKELNSRIVDVTPDGRGRPTYGPWKKHATSAAKQQRKAQKNARKTRAKRAKKKK